MQQTLMSFFQKASRPCGLFVLCVALTGCVHYHDQPISASRTAEDFQSRSLAAPALREFLKTNAPAIAESAENNEWNLESLTWAAVYFQPALQVARAQYLSAEAAIKTAGGRPNPILTVTPGYDFTPTPGLSPWIPLANIDVPIETAGKRSHRLDRARHLADAARFNMATAAWQVRSALRAGLADFTAASLRVKFLQAQLDVQNRVVKLLEERVAAGAIAPIEVTAARVARTRALADLADARRIAAESRSRVAEAVGVPLKALENVHLAYNFNASSVRDLLAPELRQKALTTRADVLASLAEYAASQANLQLEIAKQYPDLHIGTGYQWDQGDNKWSLGVTAEIPVLNRNQGPIAEAAAKRTEAAARFTGVQAKVLAEIERASSSFTAVQEQIAQLESARESQQKLLDSLQASLKAGAADQMDVATAELELRAGDLALSDTRYKLQQSAAFLEDALQQPFDALRALNPPKSPEANTKKP